MWLWLNERLKPEGLGTVHVTLTRAINETLEEHGKQPKFVLEKSPKNSLSVTFGFRCIFNEFAEFEPFLRGMFRSHEIPLLIMVPDLYWPSKGVYSWAKNKAYQIDHLCI